MKVFITNQYGYTTDKTVADRQNKFARVGHDLGFYEMGFFVCDLSSDNETELSKRLDGIISSLEKDDIVIIQLPTGNGQKFEEMLFSKIIAYSGRKPLILWQSRKYYYEMHTKYLSFISDEKKLVSDLKNDVLDLESKKILIDFVCDINKRNDLDIVENEDIIHIAFGLHDKNGNYCVWIGTTMQSIIEHTDAKIVFHILHDDTLNSENRKKLRHVAEREGDKIEFHSFDTSIFGNLNNIIGRYTIGTMFRILLPEILPDISRIIYLDADLFVNRDIKDLWKMDISQFCVAAVPDYPTVNNSGTPYPVEKNQVRREKYFNAGVLYMNLDNMRRHGKIAELILTYLGENPKAFLFDQDALNAVFTDQSVLLDQSWNYFICQVRQTEYAKAESKIYHYAATQLALCYKNEVDFLYYQTILRTPWGEEGNKCLKQSVFRLVDRAEQIRALLHKIVGKNTKIIFYGLKDWSMRNAIRLLNMDEDKCECYEHLDGNMIENTNDVVYIVSADAENKTGIEKLKGAGLRLGENYFITQRFLDVAQGGFIL